MAFYGGDSHLDPPEIFDGEPEEPEAEPEELPTPKEKPPSVSSFVCPRCVRPPEVYGSRRSGWPAAILALVALAVWFFWPN